MEGRRRELPRVSASDLTYERFLLDFALPRVPFILEGVGSDWAASRLWHSLDHFLSHPDGAVDLTHECTITEGDADAAERECTVGEALRLMKARQDAPAETSAAHSTKPIYLGAWDYVRGGSAALQSDFVVPRYFERAPEWLSGHPLFGSAAIDMRWLYIGEQGSGSPTHVDTNFSSAWLFVASGEKEWVCAHGEDYALIVGAAKRREGVDGIEGAGGDGAAASGAYESAKLPNLFEVDLVNFPELSELRLYHGVQRAGEVVFNPSRCVHAVRNLSFTVSLTHNFIDATNIADAAVDAASSIHAELLPMAKALGAKKVLKVLRESCQMKRAAIDAMLQALPTLLSDERLEELLETAVEGAVGEGAERSAVRALLDGHLRESLQGAADLGASVVWGTPAGSDGVVSIRDAFGQAAQQLCEALSLPPQPSAVLLRRCGG